MWTDWGQPLLAAGNNGTYYYPLPEMIRGVQGGRRDNIWPEGRGRKTSGPDIVGTAHFPDDWQGTLIAGGYISNAVWALRVEDDGAGFRLVDREAALEGSASALPTPAGAAPRPAGIPRTDEANPAAAAPPRRTTQALVTSTHPSFRPVDVKFGPDGALYICDWYNPIIGHYQSSFRHPDRDKAHGRIWRVTAKGRPLVVPPPIAGADLAQLFENLKSPERYVRYATKLELAGRSGPEVPRGLRDWCDRLDRNDPATEHARYEALGVFEWLNWPNPILLNQALNSKLPGLRAYAVGVLGRWADSVPESPSGPENLVYLAKDKDARVRLAAVVASGNIPKPESVVAMMTAAEEPRDKSIDLALTSAAKVLAPFAEKALAAGKPEWRESFAKLAGPNAPPHRTAPPTAAPPMTVTISPAPLGKYRATPDFVASLTPEIQTKGDAKNGGVIYNKIGCAACHALGGVGGTIGPALDAIGTGHPLDFIIGATIEPQREVKEGFECYDVKTKDGATYSGYFVAGTEAERTLRDLATGKEVKLRPADIAEKTFRGSVMPANLTDALTRDELRDLIAFLAAQGKPQ